MFILQFTKYTTEQICSYDKKRLATLLTSLILGKEWFFFSNISEDSESLCLPNTLGQPYYQPVINISDFNSLVPLLKEYNISIDIDGELLGNQLTTAYSNLLYDDITGAILKADYSFSHEDLCIAITGCLILIIQDKVFCQ